ncbi:tyrosine-type recombinase/integrase [Isosphaeraceae bacterium EP7]
MASYDFDPKSGRYHIRFRHAGKPYKRALLLKDDRAAMTLCGRVEETLRDIALGRCTVPPDAEVGAFLLSGGKVAAKPQPVAAPLTLGRLFDLYQAGVAAENKAASTRYTEDIHVVHLKRHLGGGGPVTAVDLAAANRYVATRRKDLFRGRPVDGATAKKELKTLRIIWAWGQKHGHLPGPPPFALGDVEFPKGIEKEPFRTRDQIEAIIAGGRVAEQDARRYWEGLYLTREEVREVLGYVGDHAAHDFVHPMFCVAACTGARRSEIVRSQREDWDLDAGVVAIRQKKQDKSRTFTRRYVEVNSLLSGVMSTWFASHPGGASALCLPDGRPLTVSLADDYFERALKGSRWEKVLRGFHVFRHTFASLLASEGVDQRVIDAFMGHSTEIRVRYQHLFPKDRASAIGRLLG